MAARKKTAFKSGYTAEFTMGMFDYARIDKILTTADNMMYEVVKLNNQCLRPYYSILKVLYINLRPIMYETRRVIFEKELNKILSELFKWEKQGVGKLPIGLIHSLERLHMALLDVRQTMGMGIAAVKHEALETQLNRLLLGKNLESNENE